MDLANVPAEVTQLLNRWSSGDPNALDEILGLVYGYLKGEARRQLLKSGYRDQLVQPTLLVHEAYLKFRKDDHPTFVDRSDFEWFASRIIRNVLVDHIRAMNTAKRKAEELLPLDESHQTDWEKAKPGLLDPELFLDISKAMDRLEAVNPRRCQIVTLRFIMGKTIAETAKVLGFSPTLVKNEWTAAQAWLFKQIQGK